MSEKITDHPFVPGNPEHGYENQCAFHVFAYGADRHCGAPRERHTQSIPRGLYYAMLAQERERDEEFDVPTCSFRLPCGPNKFFED